MTRLHLPDLHLSALRLTPLAQERLRSLDWLNFFVANVQTGFGPFIAVYLASEAWTQQEIGAALSVGTLAAMASQLPGGAAVDALRNKRLAALAACIALAISALMFAVWPTRAMVLGAEVLHGFASCMLGPAIAAISLQLVGRAGLGERLGRNARYAAIGSGAAAALLGAWGSYVSEQGVFYLTALLMLPGIFALWRIGPPRALPPGQVDTPVRRGEKSASGSLWQSWRLLLDRRLLIFGLCAVLFHLSNAAVLPLAGVSISKRMGSSAGLVIAACIVLPQILVALLSPWVGRAADRWGRRPILALGFLALPVRTGLLAVVDGPIPLVMIQTLDGVSAAAFGVLLPLVTSDLTRGTNRFNLCMGALGLAIGGGATISTALAGWVAGTYGTTAALLVLAAAGLAAFGLVALAMPETRPETQSGTAGAALPLSGSGASAS